jgi:hypothetical protein
LATVFLPGCDDDDPSPTVVVSHKKITTQDRIYNWLRSVQDPGTGLLQSYHNTADAALINQAFTYDQALAGMCFIKHGDKASAARILDFSSAKWAGAGLANSYNTANGNAMEGIIHTGPNLWIALLALQFNKAAGNNTYLPLATNICKWATALDHSNGGVSMGPAAPWNGYYSTEHNDDYYAVLKILSVEAADPADRALFAARLAGVKSWLLTQAYDPVTKVFNRGGGDPVKALDASTWFISAVGPATVVSDFGLDPDEIVTGMENLYTATDNVGTITVSGSDFTDAGERSAISRPPMVWVEGTLQMANVYFAMNEYHISGDPSKAEEYREKAQACIEQMDQLGVDLSKKRRTYSYATQSATLTFFNGARTPQAAPDGTLAYSVAGASWRYMAAGFNPLILGGGWK